MFRPFAGCCPKLTIRKREKQGKSRDYANGRNDVPYVPPIVLSYVSVVVERPSFLEVNSSRKFNQESEKG